MDVTPEFMELVVQQRAQVPVSAISTESSVTGQSALGDFHSAARDISLKIHRTSKKIQQLVRFVKSTSMFNNPEEQINALVHSVKSDITTLNQQMEAADQFVQTMKSQRSGSSQSQLHSSNVVGALKSELSSTASSFKDALQRRTESLRVMQSRQTQLEAGAGSSTLMLGAPQVYRPMQASQGGAAGQLPRPGGVPGSGRDELGPPTGFGQAMPLAALSPWALEEQKGGPIVTDHESLLQTQLIPDQSYLQSRAQAMNEVEGSIGELSQIFNRLATIISQHSEAVERIADHVDLAAENVQSGYTRLLRTLQSRFSDRNLVIQVFSILVLFLVFFTVFVA